MTLTKADLAKKVADDCGFLKGEAQEIVDKLLDVIKFSLISGEDVMISGFGKWSAKEKRARQIFMRNRRSRLAIFTRCI
jgi:integration host factor subunit alpha